MKRILLSLLVFTLGLNAVAADDMDRGVFLGALLGQQSDGIKPLSYGLTLGTKKKYYGFEGLYITGSKKAGSLDQSITQVGARFNLFLGQFLYFGPQLSRATYKVAATKSGVTVSASASGTLYGAAGGFNVPMGRASLGLDVSYLTGKVSKSDASLLSIMGTLKLWF